MAVETEPGLQTRVAQKHRLNLSGAFPFDKKSSHTRCKQNDKLLFSKLNAVIANQSADWCGNPPDEWNEVTITTKKREFYRTCGFLSQHCTSNRGIATTSVRTGSQ